MGTACPNSSKAPSSGLSFSLTLSFSAMSIESLIPRTNFNVLAEPFHVDSSYAFVKELGQGAYGLVCAAKNMETGDSVAIKKVTKIFTKKILTKRALREIKLLAHFRGHKNITCLYEELMEADLHAIIRSGQPLTDQHFQSFIYQTLCGLLYIHSASLEAGIHVFLGSLALNYR